MPTEVMHSSLTVTKAIAFTGQMSDTNLGMNVFFSVRGCLLLSLKFKHANTTRIHTTESY